jgi:hypothetical protein
VSYDVMAGVAHSGVFGGFDELGDWVRFGHGLLRVGVWFMIGVGGAFVKG